jgi:glycosyltransferase involved in cell wall biosynthesis
MKILAILFSPPVPATAGYCMRNCGLLQALALEGHEVTVIAFASAEEIASPAPEFAGLCRAFHLLPSQESSMAGRLCATFGTKPYGALRMNAPAMRSLVREHLAKGKFDAILCDDLYMAGNIPEGNRVPVVLNKHSITCRAVSQFAASERNPLKKWYATLEARKIQRLEVAACASAQAVAVCSARDGELLSELSPTARLFVVPNVVDTQKYAPVPPEEGGPVLFVGAMDWLPNQDGVEFLVRDILPRLRQLAPTVRVMLAGRNPSEAMLRRYAGVSDVSFTGMVADLRPLIAQAAVCVVPLRIGSGTRLKILEAAAMAKPIVSTTLGAEGLDLRHDREILLEDRPDAFAEAVALLLTDRMRASALGSAARLVVEEQYSIPALRRQLRHLLASLQSSPAAATGSPHS